MIDYNDTTQLYQSEGNVMDSIGKIFETLNFGRLEVVEYKNSSDVTVRFLETGSIKKSNMANIRSGRVRDDKKPMYKPRYKKGDVVKTKSSGLVEVLDFVSSRLVVVRFIETGNVIETRCSSLDSGYLKDRERPEICGVGFIGHGKYRSNGCHVEAYNHWTNMLRRCYDPKCDSYKYYGKLGVRVDSEWHNYQLFADWFFENRPENLNVVYLDKDIGGGDRMIYSKTTCLLVSASENNQEVVSRKFGTFSLKDPHGNVFEVHNQTRFAKENGLRQSCISNLRNGKQETHKGWKLA